MYSYDFLVDTNDSLNNVIIPRASIYLRHAADLMDSDIEEIKRALYLSPKAKQLDAERKELLESLMVLDMEINDHLQNIDIYNSLVKDAEAYLQSKQSSYEQAKSSKPSKPFFLFNWLSFGALKKNYNRNIYEWDASCRPLIAEYENLQVDHKLNNDELAAHRKGLAETKQRYTQLNQKLKSINDKIKKELAASPEVKTKMLKHLRPLVGLMRLGREIAESKLDSRLVSAVSVKLNGDVPQLSSELEQHIDNFGKTLSENLNISHRSVAQMIDGADPLMLPKDNEQAEMIIREREADVAKLTETANNSIQQGISLLQNVAKLKIEQENNRLTRAAYDREYDRLMSQFKWMLSSVNDKANVVREISRKVNLATSAEERKRNLLLLSELSGSSLSEADFEEFINGDKTITL